MLETIKPLEAQPITIRKITLWRREVDSRPGTLAGVLKPFVRAGTDLQVVMRYRHPREDRPIVEVCPPPSEEENLRPVMQAAGFTASSVPALLIEGTSVPGLSSDVARTIADLDLKTKFLVAQISDGKYAATIGFESDTDVEKAAVYLLLLIHLETLGHEDDSSAGETQ